MASEKQRDNISFVYLFKFLYFWTCLIFLYSKEIG